MSKTKKQSPAGESATRQAPDVYLVVNPLTYGEPEVRREAGEEVSDLPAASIPWLLEQEHITAKGAN